MIVELLGTDLLGTIWADDSAANLAELVFAKLKDMRILPSDLGGDEDFLRRVTLDTVGVPPTEAELNSFLSAAAEERASEEAKAQSIGPLHERLRH